MNKIKILFNLGERKTLLSSGQPPSRPVSNDSGGPERTSVLFMADYRTEAPQILRDFLSYHETIKAHSRRTVDEYFLDLRNFFRYLKQTRDPALAGKALDEISDAFELVRHNMSNKLLMWDGGKITSCEPLGEGALPSADTEEE